MKITALVGMVALAIAVMWPWVGDGRLLQGSLPSPTTKCWLQFDTAT